MIDEPTTRREALKLLSASGVGVAALSGLGTGTVGVNPGANPGANPDCEFTCSDGIYVKYELVEQDDGTCTLEEETDTGIFGDSLTITETKDGDTCEPLAVSWDGSENDVSKVTAFGGTDCDEVTDPDGTYNAVIDGDAGLENRAGKQAAISNLQFCVNQPVYVQADFVKGDVLEDLCNDSYSARKISSISWSSTDGQLNGQQGQFDGSWEFVDDMVRINYNTGDYDQKVSLAVYQVEDPEFKDNGTIDFAATRCRQTLISWDTDLVEDMDGTLEAELPS